MDDAIELIGGTEMYMPVCRECFVFKTNQQKQKEAQAKNQLQTLQFEDDETLLSVTKTRGAPVQDASLSSIAKSEGSSSSQSSPESQFSSPSDIQD